MLLLALGILSPQRTEQWEGKEVKDWPRVLPLHHPFLGPIVHRTSVLPGKDRKARG